MKDKQIAAALKVTQIKAAIGVTINLGDYQSARFDVGAEAEDDGTGYDQLKTLLAQRLDALVKDFGETNPLQLPEDTSKKKEA